MRRFIYLLSGIVLTTLTLLCSTSCHDSETYAEMRKKEKRAIARFIDDNDVCGKIKVISEEEFVRDHSRINHGGFVFRTGKTGVNGENKHVIEYSLKLDSNPEFTGSVLTAYARAIYRLSQKGDFGCKTVFDIAPALLSPLSGEELRAHLL